MFFLKTLKKLFILFQKFVYKLTLKKINETKVIKKGRKTGKE